MALMPWATELSPLMKMTGTCQPLVVSWACSCTPLSPGICMSMSSTAGLKSTACAKKSLALSNWWTS